MNLRGSAVKYSAPMQDELCFLGFFPSFHEYLKGVGRPFYPRPLWGRRLPTAAASSIEEEPFLEVVVAGYDDDDADGGNRKWENVRKSDNGLRVACTLGVKGSFALSARRAEQEPERLEWFGFEKLADDK